MSLQNETLRPVTETRPRRSKPASRDPLETETSSPRLQACVLLKYMNEL